nr:hypothetical protein [uncultured Flavobacterium sp.]
MKKLLLVLFLSMQGVYAQDITLKWAEKIPTKAYVSILGGKNGLYYTTYVNKKDELIGRTYDRNLNLKNEKNISFNMEDKKYLYEGAYILNNGILHFINETRRKEDKNFLYSGFSDFNLKTSDKLNVLDEVSDDDKIANFGLRSISPDSTKVLIYHENIGKKREPNVLVYKVYNSGITDVVNDGMVSLPIKSKNYDTEEVRVDNLGNVYVLAKIIKEKSEKEKYHSEYYYKLIVFTKDKSVKEFDFDYAENDISYIDMIAGKNNTFFCTGFLTNLKGGKKKLLSDEMFYVALDCNTLKLGESKMLKVEGLYPDEIKNREDFVPYKIRKIYQKSDGGFSIVAEQYKLIVTTHTSQYGTSTSYTYYYCDIACIQVDNKIAVTSITRVPKYQRNAGNPSVISTFKNNKTYIVYEDLTSNLQAVDDKKTKRSSKSFLSSDSKNSLFLLTVDSKGEPNKEIIYGYRESDLRPRILASREISNGEILLNADNQIGLLKIGK